MAVADDIRPSSEALLKSQASRRPANMGQFVRWALLFLGGIAMVMPIAYMLSTSLKWPHEVYNLKLVPDEPTIENYTYVLEDGRFVVVWYDDQTPDTAGGSISMGSPMSCRASTRRRAFR